MRPHNSGHWTIEGAAHLASSSSTCGRCWTTRWATPALTAPVVVMANVLGGPSPAACGLDERLHHLFAADPGVKVHLYGKQVRPGRKIGHVTALGDDLADAPRGRARSQAATWLG